MRTIIITGASGGLAQEMVKLLPEDRLILLGRNQEKLEKLYASHPQAVCIGLDITDSSALQKLVEELTQRYGKIDVLVNNAGYGIFEEFDQITNEQIHAMFEVNTFALMNLSRMIGAHMKTAGKGHIVNIVSMAGLVATAKSSLYSATKFAAIGFSNALRLELMPFGVHVTTVNPGPIRTTLQNILLEKMQELFQPFTIQVPFEQAYRIHELETMAILTERSYEETGEVITGYIAPKNAWRLEEFYHHGLS